MFVIVHKDSVIKGPNDWNKFRFEEVIRDDCEVEVTLNTRNDDHSPVIISDDIKILPTRALDVPTFNPRIQFLDGPHWNFTDDNVAEMYHIPTDMSITTAKTFFMDKVTSSRYAKENAGFKKTIQGTQVTIDTSRDSRSIFLQAYLTMADTDTLNWKFPECWLNISKSELGEIVTDGRNHIQSCFDWEKNWRLRSESITTLIQLDSLYDELEEELNT